MTEAEREALIEAGTHEYALQAVAQRLSEHLGRPIETADVVEAVDELIDEARRERQRRQDAEYDSFWERD